MNNKIANIIVDYIKDLTWIDKLAGLTQVAKINQNGVEKRYPVSCQMSSEDACIEGCYNDLTPNSAYQSVAFFEDGGFSFLSQRGNKLYYESYLRLIVWLNYTKLGGGCGSTGNYIIDIIRALPSYPVNVDGLIGVNIQIMSQAIRGTDIFNKYTYNEKQTQYFMLPYDAFALEIKTSFFLIPECVEDTSGCEECVNVPPVVPDVPPQALELTFDDIANVPVADASSVSNWNTFFDLPNYGTVFTSVTVTDNIVKLYGASIIVLYENIFNGMLVDAATHLLAFEDKCSCVIATELATFRMCSSLVYYLPVCIDLGGTSGDDLVFNMISLLTITLTIPLSLMIRNAGNPDGDIQTLQANNTVTIIQV